MNPMPEDPMSIAHEAWVAMHELYLAMRKAGFEREDAAAVLAAMFKTNTGASS